MAEKTSSPFIPQSSMFLPKIFARPEDAGPVAEAVMESANDKTATHEKSNDDGSSVEAQEGVLKMEAIFQVWSRNHIILAYIL
jgi:hypothetical protein